MAFEISDAIIFLSRPLNHGQSHSTSTAVLPFVYHEEEVNSLQCFSFHVEDLHA